MSLADHGSLRPCRLDTFPVLSLRFLTGKGEVAPTPNALNFHTSNTRMTGFWKWTWKVAQILLWSWQGHQQMRPRRILGNEQRKLIKVKNNTTHHNTTQYKTKSDQPWRKPILVRNMSKVQLPRRSASRHIALTLGFSSLSIEDSLEMWAKGRISEDSGERKVEKAQRTVEVLILTWLRQCTEEWGGMSGPVNLPKCLIFQGC